METQSKTTELRSVEETALGDLAQMHDWGRRLAEDVFAVQEFPKPIPRTCVER